MKFLNHGTNLRLSIKDSYNSSVNITGSCSKLNLREFVECSFSVAHCV